MDRPRRPPVARRSALGVVLALALAVAAAPAAPAQDGPALTLAPTSGPAGTAVDARGERFPAGFEATLRLDDARQGPVLADGVAIGRDGTFTTAFVIPRGVAPGDHLVHVCVRRGTTAPVCDRMPSARFRVTAPPTPTSRPPLTTTSSRPPATTTTRPRASTTTTAPAAGLGTPGTPTTDGPTTTLGEAGVTTTTSGGSPGVGVLAGPTTTHGLGLGELQGDAEQPDLEITGLEITQGIQNLDNDMPLVAHRTTVLRVYVQTDGGTLPHVSGVLQLVRNGTQEVAVLEPDNGPLTVDGDPPDRLDVDGSLNFTLPDAALGPTSQGNRLVATAFVFGTHPSAPAQLEPTDVNNFEADVFELHTVGDLTVHLLPMHMHELPDPSAPDATYLTSPTDVLALAATLTSLYRYHPVAGVSAVMGPTVHPPLHGLDVPYDWFNAASTEWDLTLDGVEASILGQVQAVWAESSTTESHLDQYYGIYREDLPREWGGFSNGTVAYGYYDLAYGEDTPWYHRAGWLAAHELGHSIGFPHVGCAGTEESPGDYPWSDPCTLGPVDPEGFYGWDIRHDSFAVTDGPTVISPAPGTHPHNGYPYMGYQSSKWTDPWHYCRALERFGVECRALPIPENEPGATEGPDLSATQPYQPAEGQTGWVEVWGFDHQISSPRDAGASSDAGGETPIAASRFGITVDGASLGAADGPVILDVELVDEPLPHVLDAMARRRALGRPSGVTAAVIGEDGGVLAELELVATMQGAGRAQDDAPGSFVGATSDYLRWFDDAVAVQLRVDGKVVDERRASASAPSVRVVAPAGGELQAPVDVVWEAADADGDDLAFDVAYSPDGGTTWVALAHYVTGSSYTVADTSILPGGDQAIFQVTARDGLHATSATSAPAALADQAPHVLILSPGEGTTVPQHRSLTLLAGAGDPEGGEVTVTWSSDRDGPLGTGAHLVTPALAAGEHVLTATAADAAGRSSSASVHVTIDAGSALPRLDAAGFDAARQAFAAGPASLADLEPVAADGSGSATAWAAGALALAAILGAAVAVRRGRAARQHLR